MNVEVKLPDNPATQLQVEKHVFQQARLGASRLETPDVSILILTKDEERNIKECLDTVFAQDSSGRSEVILIDSGSTDRTVEIACRYPLRLYRLAENAFHHARTRNLGAELARGEYLIYLAADALPCNENWLAALLRNFADAKVGAVYGRQVPRQNASIERRTVLDRMYAEGRLEKSSATKAELGYRYYHFSTVNCAIRKEVWQETRFPTNIKVCEDVAIATGILDAGWKIVYEPNAAVYHNHEFSSWHLFRRYFDMGVIYHNLNIWTATSQKMLLRDGLRALRAKVGVFHTHYAISARAAGVCQDAAKFAGLVLGSNERWLPRALKRRLSAFGLFD